MILVPFMFGRRGKKRTPGGADFRPIPKKKTPDRRLLLRERIISFIWNNMDHVKVGPEKRAVKKVCTLLILVYLQLTGFLLELLFFATKIYSKVLKCKEKNDHLLKMLEGLSSPLSQSCTCELKPCVVFK